MDREIPRSQWESKLSASFHEATLATAHEPISQGLGVAYPVLLDNGA